MTSSHLFKFLRIAALASSIAVAVLLSVAPHGANDFWLQAKVGELIVEQGSIPSTLLFPFTEVSESRFNAHEWLPSVIFHGMLQVVGEDGLPFVLGGLGLVLFGLTVVLAWQRGHRNLPVALLFGLVALANENYRHILRPELLSLLLFVLYLNALTYVRQHPRAWRVWLGALLMVILWVNSHASFPLATVVAGVYTVGLWLDGWRAHGPARVDAHAMAWRFLLFSLAVMLCTFVTPLSLDQTLGVFGLSNSVITRTFVLEWLHTFNPRFFDTRYFWIGVVTAVLTGIALVVRWRRVSAVDALMYLAFTLLAAYAIRFPVYLGILAAFVLPPVWTTLARVDGREAKLFLGVTLLNVVLAVLIMQFGNANGTFSYYADTQEKFTPPMVRELSNPAMRGNIITSYTFGSELVYRAYPRLKPSLDSRIDSYGDDYIRFHETLLINETLMEEFVKRYDVRYMLIKPAQFATVQKWPSWQDHRWTLRLMDSRAVLLQRN